MTKTILTAAALALTAAPALAQTQPQTQPGAPAGTAPAAAPAAPAVSPLTQIPGLTTTYYDVTGTTIEELRASIEAQRPRDPATGIAIPSSATWRIRTNVQRATTGTQCRIVGATAAFTAEVTLPRLVATDLPAPVLQSWQTYIAGIEQQQANYLLRPLRRLSEVEQAVRASTCEGAAAASNAANDRITAAPPAPTPPTPPATTPAPAQ